MGKVRGHATIRRTARHLASARHNSPGAAYTVTVGQTPDGHPQITSWGERRLCTEAQVACRANSPVALAPPGELVAGATPEAELLGSGGARRNSVVVSGGVAVLIAKAEEVAAVIVPARHLAAQFRSTPT